MGDGHLPLDPPEEAFLIGLPLDDTTGIDGSGHLGCAPGGASDVRSRTCWPSARVSGELGRSAKPGLLPVTGYFAPAWVISVVT